MAYRYYAELMDGGERWQVGYEYADKTKSRVVIAMRLPEQQARKLAARLQEAADKEALRTTAGEEQRRVTG
jgi:hypothetical protein